MLVEVDEGTGRPGVGLLTARVARPDEIQPWLTATDTGPVPAPRACAISGACPSSSTTGRRSRDAASSCACCSRTRAPTTSTSRGPKGGMAAMMRFLDGERAGRAAVRAAVRARSGDVVVSQTANVLAFLAPRLGLVPDDDALRAEAQPDPAHDRRPRRRGARHAPPDRGRPLLRGPEARGEAARAGLRRRAPAEVPRLARARARARAAGEWLVGRACTYVDLSAFQVVEGLRYAFPNAMARAERKLPRLVALRDRVAARPRIAGVPRVGATHPVQPGRDLPALPGARRARRRGASDAGRSAPAESPPPCSVRRTDDARPQRPARRATASSPRRARSRSSTRALKRPTLSVYSETAERRRAMRSLCSLTTSFRCPRSCS